MPPTDDATPDELTGAGASNGQDENTQKTQNRAFRVAVNNDDAENIGESEQSTGAKITVGANDEALIIQINALAQDHEDLHAAIEALAEKAGHDALNVARLKKKKLQLKDELERLKNRLTPDIIA